MRLSYDRFFQLLKERGIKQKVIILDLNLGGGVIQKIRDNGSITTATIGKICEYLRVQPNDIMEVIYDDEVDIKRSEIENQIADLKKKLKNMEVK